MPDPGLPPPPPGRDQPARSTDRPGTPANPTTYPARQANHVDDDIRAAETQRAHLEADMRRTGQTDALVVAPLGRIPLVDGRACTSTTWTSTHITVLPLADVIVLVEIPTAVAEAVRSMTVRWDVAARVCGTSCWQRVPGLDPPRWITRRWPSSAELAILAGLELPPR